jgi:hypothetical protein
MNTLAGEIELPEELLGRLGGPIRLVDVGARGGLEPPWPAIAGRLEAIGFEPAADAFEHLLRTAPPNVTYLNVALDAHPGEVTLYLTRGRPTHRSSGRMRRSSMPSRIARGSR